MTCIRLSFFSSRLPVLLRTTALSAILWASLSLPVWAADVDKKQAAIPLLRMLHAIHTGQLDLATIPVPLPRPAHLRIPAASLSRRAKQVPDTALTPAQRSALSDISGVALQLPPKPHRVKAAIIAKPAVNNATMRLPAQSSAGKAVSRPPPKPPRMKATAAKTPGTEAKTAHPSVFANLGKAVSRPPPKPPRMKATAAKTPGTEAKTAHPSVFASLDKAVSRPPPKPPHMKATAAKTPGTEAKTAHPSVFANLGKAVSRPPPKSPRTGLTANNTTKTIKEAPNAPGSKAPTSSPEPPAAAKKAPLPAQAAKRSEDDRNADASQKPSTRRTITTGSVPPTTPAESSLKQLANAGPSLVDALFAQELKRVQAVAKTAGDSANLQAYLKHRPANIRRLEAKACQRLSRRNPDLKLAPLAFTPLGCGAVKAAAVSTIGQPAIQLHPAGVVNCRLMEHLTNWLEQSVQPAAREILAGSVTGIEVAASYHCRRRNNAAAGKLSEHAFANAIDISGFRLVDGRVLSVGKDWNSKASNVRRFFRHIRRQACVHFTTVIGPDGDTHHQDHLHVDLGWHGRDGTYRVCE